MTPFQDPTATTEAQDKAALRAIGASGVGTWEIDLATDRALHRSRHHDLIFGHAQTPPDWGFAAMARQVVEEDRTPFLRAVEAARATGVLRHATRIGLPGGGVRWIALAGGMLPGPPGSPPRMAGTVADVTNRFVGYSRLRDSEARLRLALDLSALGVFEFDFASDEMAWSSEVRRIYGLPAQPVTTTSAAWRACVVPEDLERMDAETAEAVSLRTPRLPLRYRIRRPDGDIRQLESLVAFTYAPDGKPLFCIGVNRDITEERAAAEALAQSEARYRAMFDQVAVGVVETDAGGRWLRVNRRLVEMLGYARPDEPVGRTDAEMLHPDDRDTAAAMAASLGAGQIAYFARDQRLLRRDGSTVWVHATVSLVRDAMPAEAARRIAIFVDATERKQAEAALAEARERLMLAQDAAGVGFWDIDIARRVFTYTRAYARMRGLPSDAAVDLTAQEWLAHVHPADRKRVNDAIEAALVTGSYEQEFRVVWPDGAMRHVASRGRTQFAADGRPLRLIGMAVDVTTLRENESRLVMAMEGTGLATWDYNASRSGLRWSANHFPLFGYTVDPSGQASHAMWRDRVHPDDLHRVTVAMDTAGDQPFRLVYRIRRAGDGTERWMESIGRTLQRGDASKPRRSMGITLDVTEREESRRRLEEQQDELLHISRLADAGVMASALAHELGQPLTAASSALQGATLVLSRLDSVLPPQAMKTMTAALDMAEGQITRAGRIVAGLREFVMPHPATRHSEALRPLIDDARHLAVIAHDTPADRIAITVPPGLPAVWVDGVQIRQVLFNLLRNAIQAVEECHAAPEARVITVTAAAWEDVVEVAVADNGPGLAPAVVARLFEPFTTSKSDGMGIGLSICRSIVEAHGGRIHADRNAAGGMTFRFTLPAVDLETEGGQADGA